MNWLYIPYMDYGKNRRELIMKLFNSVDNSAYCVNRKHRPQIKNDPDLKRLIKTGKLKLKREGSITSRTTYLIKS